jgi:hypothetical protein
VGAGNEISHGGSNFAETNVLGTVVHNFTFEKTGNQNFVLKVKVTAEGERAIIGMKIT